MTRLLLHWLLNAIALMVVPHVVSGFHIDSFVSALVAALVIGLLNATIGLLLKLVTLPLTILTFGIFLLVINAFVIRLASGAVSGLRVDGFIPAFWAAAVLAVLHMLFRLFTSSDEKSTS